MWMIKRLLLASIAAGAAQIGLASAQPPVAAQTAQYTCGLQGSNEVPATTSTATGTFTATLDEGAKTVSWSLSVPAITNATLAHIHAGPTGVNGPPVVTLFTSVPAGAITISATSGPADIGGPYTGNWEGFVAALKAGDVYVNVHTVANPGGEIRGQVGTVTQGTATVTAQAGAPGRATAFAGGVTPVAPKTGQAGLHDVSLSTGVVVLLAAITGAVVAGGRLLSKHHT